MDARVTLLNVAAAEAAGMTGFSHIIVEGAASPIAKGSSEVRQGDLLRAHLQALVNGLEALTRQSASGGRDSILLCLSHEYLRRGIEEWLPRWKANGWRNASRKPVAYADLWMMVDALLGRLRASNTGDTLVLRGDPNDNHQRLANQVAERALKIGLEWLVPSAMRRLPKSASVGHTTAAAMTPNASPEMRRSLPPMTARFRGRPDHAHSNARRFPRLAPDIRMVASPCRAR